MIFETICIANLFSYYGEQRFELGAPEDGRNIVLIMGRNGFGKTSFLNSLKLLFTGVDYEPLRRAVQRKRMPTVNQYVEGAGDDWWGIMNRRARGEDQDRCAVQVTWREDAGTVTVERAWHFERGSWDREESLTVTTSTDTLAQGEAQDFLDHRLPRDYVYFFLFDGEQIQELAEANRDVQQREMERLLGIGAIDALRESLISAIGAWQRDDLDEEAQAELLRQEGEARALGAELTSMDTRRGALEQEIADDGDQLIRIRRNIEGLSAFVHRHDEAQLKDTRARIEAERVEGLDRVSAQLPRDLVLLANATLVSRTLDRLDRLLGSDDATRARVLEQLTGDLPSGLFDTPDFPDPDIRDGQRAFYRYKLIRLLEQEIEHSRSGRDPAFDPDPQAATAAREQLAAYAQSEALRQARAEQLRRLQRQAAALKQVASDLLNVGALSDEERERYERYVAQREELERSLESGKQRRTDLEREQKGIETRLAEARRQADDIQNRVRQNAVTERKIGIARRLADLFAALKTERKRMQRDELETAINRHFRVLMTSHHLIDRVQMDEDFGLHYLDRNGGPIGMGSLSAGMKQLMATALLWALSEVSGKRVPVVVDTPLARIELGNQEALLRQYYPNAAAQVIVLPTDSEMDAPKLASISGHVYRAFRLDNRDGEHTVPVPVPVERLLGEG